MGQWGNATNQNAWAQGGWGQAKSDERRRPAKVGGCWTSADIAVMVIAFIVRWELGLAFLALKLWHQASGTPGSTFLFARQKWDQLVGLTREVMSKTSLPSSFSFGPKSSGNLAFDAWRRDELARIDAEREKLRASERDFAVYRDELLQAKDRDDFDRFMRTRPSA